MTAIEAFRPGDSGHVARQQEEVRYQGEKKLQAARSHTDGFKMERGWGGEPKSIRSRLARCVAQLLVLAMVGALLIALPTTPATAATAVLVPDGDVTAGWTVLGGTEDNTCGGGTHCDRLDEGSTANVGDFVSTGQSLGTGLVEQLGLTDRANLGSASQMKVYVHAQSATAGNGGSLDTLSLNLQVDGTLQTASTVTPAHGSWGWHTATFTGNWSSTQVNNTQVVVTRNVVGGGKTADQDDDIQMAAVYVELTYTTTTSFEQAGYRWLDSAATTAAPTFSTVVGTTTADSAIGIEKTSDGGYLATGSTDTYGTVDILLTKYSGVGAVLWTRTWGGAGVDYGRDVVELSDGSLIVVGSTSSYGAGSSDWSIIKYDAAGNLQWSRVWGSASEEIAYAVVPIAGGDFVVAGHGGAEAPIVRFTSAGAIVWARQWGGSTLHVIHDLITTSEGGLAMVGRSSAHGAGGNDVIVLRYDANGTLLSTRTWGGIGEEQATSVVDSGDGGLIVTGFTTSFGNGLNDAFVLKYDSAGTLTYNRTWGGLGEDKSHEVRLAPNGDFFIAGETNSYGAGDRDAFIARFDTSGTLQYSRTWGGAGIDYVEAAIITSGASLLTAGTSASYGAGGNDTLLVMYDASGNVSGCPATRCTTPSVTAGNPAATVTATGADAASSRTLSTVTPSAVNSPVWPRTMVDAVTQTVGVGAPRATTNSPATAPGSGAGFRLRMLLHVGTTDASPGDETFNLQVASRGTDNACDTSFTGESYTNVTRSSGPVRFLDHPEAGDSQAPAASTDDPSHSTHATVLQSFEDANSFGIEAPVSIGQDGLWDFSLVTDNPTPNSSYCLRAVRSDGTVLNTTSVVPQLDIPPPTLDQSAYRWFDNVDASGDATFAKSLGSSGNDRGEQIVATADGGFAVVGHTTSYGAGGTDVLLTKYDSIGRTVWARTWGGSNEDFGRGIVQKSDGGFAVAGYTSSFGAGGADTVLVQFSSDGVVTSAATWGGAFTDQSYSLVQTSDGGFAVAGDTTSYGAGSRDATLIRFDSSANVLWSRTWGGTGSDYGEGVVLTSDGGFGVGGATASFGAGGQDVFLLRYDSAGTLLWARAAGGAGTDSAFTMAVTSDDGFAVAGRTTSSGAGLNDLYLLRYDSSGTLSWVRTWGGAAADHVESLRQTSDGGFIVTGQTASYGAGGGDALVLRYAANGDLSYSRVWGGSGADTGNSLVFTADGGYAIAGSTASYGSGGNDLALLKYDDTGSIAGCAASCANVTGTIGIPVPTISSPAASLGTPSVTAGTQSASTSAVTPVGTIVTAVAPLMDVGGPRAATNTVATTPADGIAFRLRMSIDVTVSGLAVGTGLKLQVALRGTDNACDASFSGETYADVTSTSGAVRYFDNAAAADGQSLAINAGDPTHSGHTIVGQSYEEANNFVVSTTTPAGQDALWDFAFVTFSAPGGATYCFRTVKDDGTLLNSYSVVPQVATPNLAPDPPSATAQNTTGDVVLSAGGWHNSTSVKFTATISDPESNTVSLCVETKALGAIFDGTESCGALVASGGTASVTATLTDATAHHWRVRSKDAAGAYSSWVTYGTDDVNTRDVGIDTTAPTGGAVYDGSSAGVDASQNNGSLSSLSANWAGFDGNVSGVVNYDYSIGTTSGGTDVLVWTDVDLAVSVTAPGLSLRTTQLYYVNVRVTDGAGNTSVVSSNGQQVAPTLSFSISASALNLNLSPATSFTDTKSFDMTTSTNANGGYVIKATLSSLFSNPAGDAVSDFSGTWASPQAWASDVTGFGYTTNDPSVAGVNRFQAATCPGGLALIAPGCFAAFPVGGPGDVVADNPGPVVATPQTFTMWVKGAVNASQAPGNYSTTIVLTAVPTY